MKFVLANQSHDGQLRQIARAQTMPGHIQVAYEREPDFFAALNVQGKINQVMAATENGQILGYGCRSIRPQFINGKLIDFGYLSNLHSSLAAKKRMGLVRGYKMLKELHKDGCCKGYITTIIDGNVAAISTIAQGRAGLPYYKDMGECRTYAVALNRRNSKQPLISVRFARPGEEGKVVKLLGRWGSIHQFFPALSESDFGSPLLRDLTVGQFLIAEQSGKACGVAAIWDQSRFKQYRVKKYSRTLKLTRPFISAGLKLAGFSPLPKEGQLLSNAFLCFKAAENNSPEILAALLQYACNQMRQSGASHCVLGFHADDPARTITDSYPTTVYRSRLFFAGWEDDLEFFNQLDGRIPCFEPAIL